MKCCGHSAVPSRCCPWLPHTPANAPTTPQLLIYNTLDNSLMAYFWSLGSLGRTAPFQSRCGRDLPSTDLLAHLFCDSFWCFVNQGRGWGWIASGFEKDLWNLGMGTKGLGLEQAQIHSHLALWSLEDGLFFCWVPCHSLSGKLTAGRLSLKVWLYLRCAAKSQWNEGWLHDTVGGEISFEVACSLGRQLSLLTDERRGKPWENPQGTFLLMGISKPGNDKEYIHLKSNVQIQKFLGPEGNIMIINSNVLRSTDQRPSHSTLLYN